MILAIQAIPDAADLTAIGERIALLAWRDGRETAGSVAREVKRNEQAV
ncbi:MAG: PKHD-type hydroxylase, partial [Sphingomonadales bacterium]